MFALRKTVIKLRATVAMLLGRAAPPVSEVPSPTLLCKRRRTTTTPEAPYQYDANRFSALAEEADGSVEGVHVLHSGANVPGNDINAKKKNAKARRPRTFFEKTSKLKDDAMDIPFNMPFHSEDGLEKDSGGANHEHSHAKPHIDCDTHFPYSPHSCSNAGYMQQYNGSYGKCNSSNGSNDTEYQHHNCEMYRIDEHSLNYGIHGNHGHSDCESDQGGDSVGKNKSGDSFDCGGTLLSGGGLELDYKWGGEGNSTEGESLDWYSSDGHPMCTRPNEDLEELMAKGKLVAATCCATMARERAACLLAQF